MLQKAGLFCLISLLVDRSACFLALIKILLGSCVYIVKGYIYPVCVNIPIVELLLSWLGLFYLSSIINDLLPVSNFQCFFGTRGIFECNSWVRVKPSRNVVETNRGGC